MSKGYSKKIESFLLELNILLATSQKNIPDDTTKQSQTSEEDNTSEPEAVKDLVFDGNWQSNVYYNSNVTTTQQTREFMLFRQAYL